ncbi:MAG: SAM-dependent methyltransferase [Alphaproteobacteria bacterium]|nr:SAM-dependent methyltransferase [Alphaproteobacteria bacterium]
MDWQRLLDKDIQIFIRTHETDDVAALALKKAPDAAWDYRAVLEQIKARQKARKKVPQWFEEAKALVFPPSFVVEQASSAATALYKAGLVKGERFADLTGGMGVDSWALGQVFERGVCVERDAQAAALLAHNLGLLCEGRVEVVHAEAEMYVQTMKPVDFVYVDPQRRDAGQKGKYRLESCSPDILSLLPALLERAGVVMLKTSPMLDIREAIRVLGCVSAVHVVEWRGECKEVLYLLTSQAQNLEPDDIPVRAVRIDDQGGALGSFEFTHGMESAAVCEYSLPLAYLYEPGPAFQKAGAFKSLAVRLGLKKLHEHTHLYTSESLVEGFPGRVFEVCEVYPAKAKALPFARANLAVRNFPQKAEDLVKLLKIKGGGDEYVFACTFMDGRKMLVHGRKV